MKKTILITGATSGIGYETALQLARMGHRIVITARDMEKASHVVDSICGKTNNENVEALFCEMGSFESIRAFSASFLEKYDRLDVLINNAGTWETERKLSRDGIELTWAVNHLAPFLLTHLLLPLLRSSEPARIINVASEGHRHAKIRFDDPEFSRGSLGIQCYNHSKLANILFTRLLAEKVFPARITVNCLHPGIVATPIFNKLNRIWFILMRPIMITSAKGAECSVYLATSDDVAKISGEYFKNKKINPGSMASRDMETAQRLWELSEKYLEV